MNGSRRPVGPIAAAVKRGGATQIADRETRRALRPSRSPSARLRAPRRAWRPLLAPCSALVASALLALAYPAAAHELGALEVEARIGSSGTYRIDLAVELRQVPPGIAPRAAEGGTSGTLWPAARLDALRDRLIEGTEIRFDGRPASPRLVPDVAQEDAPGGVAEMRFTLGGEVPAGAETFSFRQATPIGVYALTIVQEGAAEGRTTHWLTGGDEGISAPLAPAAAPSRWATARSYLALGFTHIVPLGLDHILFVLGLFLLSCAVRPLLVQITAFTIAHSITLALSVYGVIALPSSVVEPLIALSIAWIAVENLVSPRMQPWRPAVVFAFGLLHGLGFAGVLQELGLPRSQFLTALVSFNLGVEGGQLAVVALAVSAAGLWWSRRPWYRRRLVIPASLAIAAVGLYWAVERLG